MKFDITIADHAKLDEETFRETVEVPENNIRDAVRQTSLFKGMEDGEVLFDGTKFTITAEHLPEAEQNDDADGAPKETA